MVAGAPVGTRVGFAVMSTRGSSTVTVAFAGAEVPPGPEHVIWKIEVWDSGPVETPEALLVAPLVEKPPAEVHEVAFVELQKSFVD